MQFDTDSNSFRRVAGAGCGHTEVVQMHVMVAQIS